MNKFYHYSIVTFALSFYFLLWHFLQPILGYILDTDCVAYLTIAERVAKGEWHQSINSLWSPLNEWLLVPFIKAGFPIWESAKALNCFLGGTVIVLAFSFLKKLNINYFAKICFAISFPIFMVYAVYIQMFGDVLQLIFTLIYLHLVSFNFDKNTVLKTLLAGITMGIAYYAKAYSLLFFVLHFSLTLFYYFKIKLLLRPQVIKNILLGFAVFFIVISPWIFHLHSKYNEWTTGHAGKLNMSWQINSGKTFKPNINILIPPSYANSPSYWEDPYPTQYNLSSPVSSFKHFVKWIARVIHTCMITISCLNEISFFAISIILFGVYFLFFKKNENEIQHKSYLQLLLLTALIYPLGYITMHIETRYIWLLSILLFLIGIKILAHFNFEKNYLKKASIAIFSFSFCFFPLQEIFKQRYKNKDLFEISSVINQQKIHGSFASNNADIGRLYVIAYLTHNPCYTIEKLDFTEQELLNEMKKYNVNYFFYERENTGNLFLENKNNFTKISTIQNIEIYQFH